MSTYGFFPRLLTLPVSQCCKRAREPHQLPLPRGKPRSLALAGPNVRLVKIDDHAGFIHFNRDQRAVGRSFVLSPSSTSGNIFSPSAV